MKFNENMNDVGNNLAIFASQGYEVHCVLAPRL